MALVQVASTFSKESLDKVIKKMEELRNNLELSLEEDKVNEQQAITDYNTLMTEIEQTKRNLQQAKADAEVKLQQDEGQLAFQEKRLEQAVETIKTKSAEKAAKE